MSASFDKNRKVLRWLLVVLLPVSMMLVVAAVDKGRPWLPGPAVPPGSAVATPAPGGLYFYGGIPKPAGYPHPLTVLTNNGCVSGYDAVRKATAWVCYRLVATNHLEAVPDSGPLVIPDIVPRSSAFNREVWDKLLRIESQDLPGRLGKVWVIAGPIFGDGDAGPEACFKIIADEAGGKPRVRGFILGQEIEGKDKLVLSLVTVDDIEQATGLDFFPELPAALQGALEAETPLDLW